MKFIFNLALVVLGIGFLVMLFLFRGDLTRTISRKMAEQAFAETNKTIAEILDSSFNYQKNGEAYDITFLEFGATGCISCRRMELVMKEVREKHRQSVKVIFYNIMLPENHNLTRYFGIVSIPTQILLNRSGQEVFRHTGYYSFDDLDEEFQKIKY